MHLSGRGDASSTVQRERSFRRDREGGRLVEKGSVYKHHSLCIVGESPTTFLEIPRSTSLVDTWIFCVKLRRKRGHSPPSLIFSPFRLMIREAVRFLLVFFPSFISFLLLAVRFHRNVSFSSFFLLSSRCLPILYDIVIDKQGYEKGGRALEKYRSLVRFTFQRLSYMAVLSQTCFFLFL